MRPVQHRLRRLWAYLSEQQRPPTVREIQAELRYSSSNMVWWDLWWLERYGYIQRDAERARGLRVLVPLVTANGRRW